MAKRWPLPASWTAHTARREGAFAIHVLARLTGLKEILQRLNNWLFTLNVKDVTDSLEANMPRLIQQRQGKRYFAIRHQAANGWIRLE